MSDVAAAPTIKISWFFGIAGAFLIFVIIAAYSSRMANDAPTFDRQRAAARYETLHKLQEEDNKTLTTADWVDKTKGIVRIPIQEAMDKEIDTLKAKPVQAGAEIPGAAPKPSATPAQAANNAPPAAPSTNAAPAAPAAPNK